MQVDALVSLLSESADLQLSQIFSRVFLNFFSKTNGPRLSAFRCRNPVFFYANMVNICVFRLGIRICFGQMKLGKASTSFELLRNR